MAEHSRPLILRQFVALRGVHYPHLLPFPQVHDVVTGRGGRLTQRSLYGLLSDVTERQPMSYIAGPPGMVQRTAGLLRGSITSEDIKTDRFDG
ncbi:MAG TPA: hypothetical protein VGR16_04745 [Thermomicrobiales bacterium]|nr:hypothetical protein [Thermomicrobiales bacterium]